MSDVFQIIIVKDGTGFEKLTSIIGELQGKLMESFLGETTAHLSFLTGGKPEKTNVSLLVGIHRHIKDYPSDGSFQDFCQVVKEKELEFPDYLQSPELLKWTEEMADKVTLSFQEFKELLEETFDFGRYHLIDLRKVQ